MSIIIEDGTGKGFKASVNSDNFLETQAVVVAELEHASEDGNAYYWTSQDLDIVAAGTMLLVKNTSDKNLHINKIIFTGGNVDTRWEVHVITTDITPSGGSVVTGFNINTASSNVADALARSNETGNTQGTVILDIVTLALTTIPVVTPGLIIAKNISIAVDQVTESTAGNVTIIGHYEE